MRDSAQEWSNTFATFIIVFALCLVCRLLYVWVPFVASLVVILIVGVACFLAAWGVSTVAGYFVKVSRQLYGRTRQRLRRESVLPPTYGQTSVNWRLLPPRVGELLIFLLALVYLVAIWLAGAFSLGIEEAAEEQRSRIGAELARIPNPKRKVGATARPKCLAEAGRRILILEEDAVSRYHYRLPPKRRARFLRDADVIVRLHEAAVEVPGVKRVTTQDGKVLSEYPVTARGWDVSILDTRRSVLYERSFSTETFYMLPGTPHGGSLPPTGELLKWLNLGLSRWNDPNIRSHPERVFILLLRCRFRDLDSLLNAPYYSVG